MNVTQATKLPQWSEVDRAADAPATTAPDLAAIEARLAAATPGAWKQCSASSDECICGLVWSGDGSHTVACTRDSEEEGIVRDPATIKANADLIAHAPDDLRALVARVRELEAALSASRGEWRGPPTVAEVNAHAAAEGGTWLYRYPHGPGGVLYLHDVSPSPDSRAPEWRPVTLGLDAVPWPTVPR